MKHWIALVLAVPAWVTAVTLMTGSYYLVMLYGAPFIPWAVGLTLLTLAPFIGAGIVLPAYLLWRQYQRRNEPARHRGALTFYG